MAPQPFVPLLDGAQVELLFSLGGVTVENRLWFLDRDPPITLTKLQALADGVRDWHVAEIMPWLAQELRLILVLANDWTPVPSLPTAVAGASVVGGNLSGVHSANVSIRVAFKGDNSQTFPNNSNFVPGIPKDEVDGNKYSDGIKDVLFEAYVHLIDLAGTFGASPGWRWVITSRVLNGAYRAAQGRARTDFIRFPSPYVSPRRRRMPRP